VPALEALRNTSTLQFRMATVFWPPCTRFHDKLLFLVGKVFALETAKLPGGRGHGEPVRLMIDMNAADAIVRLLICPPTGRQTGCRGKRRQWFHRRRSRLPRHDAQGQAGDERPTAEAVVCVPVSEAADHLAVVGENRKLLIFPLAQAPEMARRQGRAAAAEVQGWWPGRREVLPPAG
jgi:topoisomerase-4 subunit A